MVTSKRAPGYFVPVDESGNVGISLTGRNLVLIQTSFNALAITDTGLKLATNIPKSTLGQYKELYLNVKSTLSVAPTIKIFASGIGFNSPTASKATTDTAGAIQIMTQSDLTPLKTAGMTDIQVSAQCATAPVSGSITVELWGTPN